MRNFRTVAADAISHARAFLRRSATNKLIVICVCIYIAQLFGLFFAQTLALNEIWIRGGFRLNFVTYAFLHGNFWHLAFNAIALYFVGNAIERYETGGTVLAVFLGGNIVGGIAWYALTQALSADSLNATLVGASAGIAALFAYFSIDNRGNEIRAMLFYVVPVKMRAWLLFAILLAISVFFLFFSEIPAMRGASSGGVTIGHSAHIGGLIFGAIYALAAEFLRERFNRGNVRYF